MNKMNFKVGSAFSFGTRFFKLRAGTFLPLVSVLCASCAQLHHVQLSQIDNRAGETQTPFEIKVSEVGVSTDDIQRAGQAVGGRGGDAANTAAAIVSLFQQGPKTGNPVYDERYAERVLNLIHEKCPSGRVTGLTSIRETRKYPVISGEIVKVTGYCRTQIKKPGAAQEQSSGEI